MLLNLDVEWDMINDWVIRFIGNGTATPKRKMKDFGKGASVHWLGASSKNGATNFDGVASKFSILQGPTGKTREIQNLTSHMWHVRFHPTKSRISML